MELSKMAEIKEGARAYYEQGLNIVPVNINGNDKKPLVEWRRWETQRQTKEEFDSLPFDKANAFGVICGQKLDNGLFIGVVDFDVKNLGNEVIEKGRKALKEFPVTKMEETPSKGQHLFFHSQTKPKSVSAYHNEAALELIGEGKLCIVNPSQGYRRLNDNPPTEVKSLNTLFEGVLNRIGFKKPQGTLQALPNNLEASRRVEIRPCILELCKKTHMSHTERVAVAVEHHTAGISAQTIEQLFQKQDDFDAEITRYQINQIINGGYKRYLCSTLKEIDICLPSCPENQSKKKNKEKPTSKQLKDSGLTVNGCYEAIYDKYKPIFLMIDNGVFSRVETLETEEDTFFPIETKNFPYEPYGFYEDCIPDNETIFKMVKAEFENFIEVDDIWRDVLSACVLLSYQQEKLQTVPYLLVYGDNESGKSTVLILLNLLCYRPEYGVAIPVADIFGYLTNSEGIGCILEDEIQGIHKDVEKIKIYKSGYKKGAKVPRTIITSEDRVIKYYGTFCFKTCASEQLPSVKGFRERFIEIPMVEGSPKKEWADVNRDDSTRLQNLRNILLKWRMITRNCDLPDASLNVKGRLKELWKPILQVTNGLTVYDRLFKFIEEQRKERLNIKQETLEGKIVKVVTEIFNEPKEHPSNIITFQTIWNFLKEELGGKDEPNRPNAMDTSEFFKVTKNKVGCRLREVLSGKPKVIKEKHTDGDWVSVKAYEFDLDKLGRVARKYGFSIVLPILLRKDEHVAGPELQSNDDLHDEQIENACLRSQPISRNDRTVENEAAYEKRRLFPADISNLRTEVKRLFTRKAFTDYLMKIGFNVSDADMKFEEMKKQGYFHCIDIDDSMSSSRFKWTSDTTVN
jgi:hypothetical protein